MSQTPLLVLLGEGQLPCYTVTERDAQSIYAEIFTKREYLRDGDRLPDDATIVDVGANIGLFTLFMKKEFPASTVLAFEPMSGPRGALERNVALHELDGVTVHRVGLGAEQQEVTFSYFASIPAISTRYPDEKAVHRSMLVERFGQAVADELMRTESETVTVRRLSDVLRERGDVDRVDLLKVDVEGAELDVLQGIDDEHWPRVRRAAIEVQDSGWRVAAIEKLLASKGFTVEVSRPQNIPDALDQFMVYAHRTGS